MRFTAPHWPVWSVILTDGDRIPAAYFYWTAIDSIPYLLQTWSRKLCTANTSFIEPIVATYCLFRDPNMILYSKFTLFSTYGSITGCIHMHYVLYNVRHPAPGPPSHNGDLVSIDLGKETTVHAIVGSIAGHMCRLKPYETGDERPQRSVTSLAKRTSPLLSWMYRSF